MNLGVNPFTYRPTKEIHSAPANEYEFRIDRERHGRCATCGLQTHEVKQGHFVGTVLVPLTNDRVISGRCLLCNPFISTRASIASNSGLARNKELDDSSIIEDADDEGTLTRLSHQASLTKCDINITVPDTGMSTISALSDVHQSQNKIFFLALKWNKMWIGIAVLVIAVVVIAVSVSLGLSSKDEEEEEGWIEHEIEVHVLCRGVKFNELPQKDSRKLALDWLVYDDPMQLNVTDSNLKQRYILALLAYESGADFMSNFGWLSVEDECGWYGVTCNDEGEVSMLKLEGTGLMGTIPPEISGLSSLQFLSLSENSLFGTLPHELGQLSSLTTLQAYSNKLKGTLPTELGQIESLGIIWISDNELTGSIQSEILQGVEMTALLIEQNAFTGSLPWIVPYRPWRYKYLILGDNHFTGSIPSWIGHLNELEQLELFSNQFEGTLPTWIGNLKDLKVLFISDNNFSGALPSEIGALQTLDSLALNANYFTGSLPSEIGNMASLAYFYAGVNSFSGHLPSELGRLKDLAEFTIDYNELSGMLPTEIGDMESLTSLAINSNQLTGALPSELAQLKYLTFLWLGDNQFTGTFPPEIVDNLDLRDLCLHPNSFTTFPEEVETEATCP